MICVCYAWPKCSTQSSTTLGCGIIGKHPRETFTLDNLDLALMASLINDRLNGDTSDDGDSLILPFAESLDSVYLKSFF